MALNLPKTTYEFHKGQSSSLTHSTQMHTKESNDQIYKMIQKTYFNLITKWHGIWQSLTPQLSRQRNSGHHPYFPSFLYKIPIRISQCLHTKAKAKQPQTRQTLKSTKWISRQLDISVLILHMQHQFTHFFPCYG